MTKKQITILTAVLLSSFVSAQKSSDKSKLVKEFSDKACKCTDSIALFDRNKQDIIKDIHECIDKQTGVLQMTLLLSGVEELSKKAPEVDGKKQVNLTLNTDKNSDQYKDSYNEIERYLLRNCASLKKAVNTAESKLNHLSKDEEAMNFYNKAMEASRKEDWKEAVKNYEKAVKKDPTFTYAWDNLGICYRRLEEYDKSIEAYKKSMAINPAGKMPLQNIAIAYVYKKEYQKAIDAYSAMDKAYPGDPEVYYGMGQVYFNNLNNNEKALDYICKAYRIYNEQKSPYRSDAEAVIGFIYNKMKAENKLDKFNEILKNNNIQTQ